MLNRKLEQKGGRKSKNYQAETMTVNQGISYADARQIALDVFKANFLEMSQTAAKVARQRAEELVDDFLVELNKTNADIGIIFESPDFQFLLFEAQKEYARIGEKELENILIAVLLEGTLVDSTSLKRILINEAIKIVSKLTQPQLDIMSIFYLIKNYYDSDINALIKLKTFIEKYFTSLLNRIELSEINMQHLLYTGCCSVSPRSYIENLGNEGLIDHFYYKYKSLFGKCFTMKEYEDFRIFDSDGVQTVDVPINEAVILAKERFKEYFVPINSHSDLYKLDILNYEQLTEIVVSQFLKPSYNTTDGPQALRYLSSFINTFTMSRIEAQNLLTNLTPVAWLLSTYYNELNIRSFGLTSVGSYLAVLNLKIHHGANFDLKIID